MTVPIDAAAGLIFLVSYAVGHAVYRHTKATSASSPKAGDLGTAFTAGSVALVALAFLFGVAPDSAQRQSDEISPAGTPTATTSPAQSATPPQSDHSSHGFRTRHQR
jgi:hypothetical protein